MQVVSITLWCNTHYHILFIIDQLLKITAVYNMQ
jgi:hypothetical protein